MSVLGTGPKGRSFVRFPGDVGVQIPPPRGSSSDITLARIIMLLPSAVFVNRGDSPYILSHICLNVGLTLP